jgi:TRAP-type C4-dicarboxylate transport system permease large subunit
MLPSTECLAIDILVNRGSVNIAQTTINCAFAGMAGSATARVSGILINSCETKSAPGYVLEVSAVICRKETPPPPHVK